MMNNETFLVIGGCMFGKGPTLAAAIAAMLAAGSKPRRADRFDVRRFWWPDDAAREKAYCYNAQRAAEGLPSWVAADGSPNVLVMSDGSIQRASLMANEDVIRGGRWDGKTIVEWSAR